jgi:hypothetical protein
MLKLGQAPRDADVEFSFKIDIRFCFKERLDGLSPDLRRETARGVLVMSLQSACSFWNLQLVGFSDRQWGIGPVNIDFGNW